MLEMLPGVAVRTEYGEIDQLIVSLVLVLVVDAKYAGLFIEPTLITPEQSATSH
jgi:hypothetical protein